MSLYQCEECGAVENSALGFYAVCNLSSFKWGEGYHGRKLCSECGPPKFSDGGSTGYGKWHGKFPKMILPLGMFITNNEGNLAHKLTGDTDYKKYEMINE